MGKIGRAAGSCFRFDEIGNLRLSNIGHSTFQSFPSRPGGEAKIQRTNNDKQSFFYGVVFDG